MLKADNRRQTRNENSEEMIDCTNRLAAISNLEKRLKAKGKGAKLFAKQKEETRRKLEELRRG
jgi:hypothetical protein